MYKTASGGILIFNRFLEISVCLFFSSANRNNIKIHEICNYTKKPRKAKIIYHKMLATNIADGNLNCKIFL